jgi:hypothetical protein
MDIDRFKQAAEQPQCPSNLPKPLQALWYDKRGDWDTAHNIVQNAGGVDCAWVHAYLHRKEGDSGNARYWYGRSGKSPAFDISLTEEWDNIAATLLG